MLDALHRGEGVLYLARDIVFQLRGRSARQFGRYGNHRQVDIGKLLDVHHAEPHQAGECQQDEQQDGRGGIADRPGRDVQAHRTPPLKSVLAGVASVTEVSGSSLKAGGSSTTRTKSPSPKKLPPAKTT